MGAAVYEPLRVAGRIGYSLELVVIWGGFGQRPSCFELHTVYMHLSFVSFTPVLGVHWFAGAGASWLKEGGIKLHCPGRLYHHFSILPNAEATKLCLLLSNELES